MTLITPPPTAPNRADPATFPDRADAYVDWWATIAAEINGGALGATFVNGTVAAPSVRGNTDTNTGLNFLGSDQLQLVTNGVQRVLLNTTAFNCSLPITGTAVTQSATDTTSGRLLKFGDFGIGFSLNETSDWDNQLNSAFLDIPSTASNRPSGVFNYSGLVIRGSNANNVTQIACANNATNRLYSRARAAAVWTPWREIYTQISAVGTVSQSSSIPTGALVERISNANGTAFRFAGGLQLCFHTVATNSSGIGAWTFPAVFSSAPRCFGLAIAASDDRGVTVNTSTTTAVDFRGWTTIGNAWEGSVSGGAIGVWH